MEKNIDKNPWKDNKVLWYWFVNIDGIGIGSCWKLLDHFQQLPAIWEAGEKEFKGLLTPRLTGRLLASRKSYDPEKAFKRLEKAGIRFIHWESRDYPAKLRNIFQPPLGLYLKGRLPDENRPSMAMVGSRRPTNYGKMIAGDYAQILARSGVQIISGMAAGIDTCCHRGALQAGGYTVGVLGGGIDTIYPKGNFNLYYEMYDRGGILSEYNIGTPNLSGLFPLRNRIISGLADGVFVIEAGSRSGSLITADHGLEQGKDIFALPGRITDPMSRGCNELVAQGAVPVLGPETLLDAISPTANVSSSEAYAEPAAGFVSGDTSSGDSLSGDTLSEDSELVFRQVLNRIDISTGTSFDQLAMLTQMNRGDLEYILYKMELSGLIFQPLQGLYQRRGVKI